MTYSFVIEGRLPSLNQFINAERNNRYGGNKFKAEHQRIVELSLINLVKKRNDDHSNYLAKTPIKLHYRWYEANLKRDLDNVSGFGHKVIQDALVAMQIIPDDSPKYIVGMTDDFYLDRENPRIEVDIEEV